jgi:hypothetical protein
MIIVIQKPHSIVDLITNSSTEIFVVKKDSEMIQDFINGILNSWQVTAQLDFIIHDEDVKDPDNEGAWCENEIMDKLKELNLTRNDVIIFECNAHAFFYTICEEIF